MNIHDLWVGFVAVSSWKLVDWVREQRRMPYGWRCDDCGARVRTSSRDASVRSRAIHNDTCTKEDA